MGVFWQELFRFLGGMAIASAALAWLAKQIIVHFLSKDVEAYKVQLKAESDKEIESLKSQLQLLNQQQIIRFSTLHNEQIEFAKYLYTSFRIALNQARHLKKVCLSNSSLQNERIDAEGLAKQELDMSVYQLDCLLDKNRVLLTERTIQKAIDTTECLKAYSRFCAENSASTLPQKLHLNGKS